jgi:hypothetical protein
MKKKCQKFVYDCWMHDMETNWDNPHVIFSIYDLLKARARKGEKKMKKWNCLRKTHSRNTHKSEKKKDESEICKRNLNDMTFTEIVEGEKRKM